MSRTTGRRTRKRMRFAAGQIQKTANTIAGRRMKAVPFVRVARPIAAPASTVLAQLAADFQRRRKKQLATIQNETATSGFALVAARTACGIVPHKIAARS